MTKSVLNTGSIIPLQLKRNECLKDFHDQGGSGQVVRDALTKVPLDADMIKTCQLLHAKGWTLVIVSDANSIYIDGILQHYGIRHLFSAVITNPAFWDSQDRLHIQRLIPTDAPPHGCPLGICSLNICKGQEIDKLLKQLQQQQIANNADISTAEGLAPAQRMLYVGDGRNDYCPALRMQSSQDIYFVRKGRSLEAYLEKGAPGIREAIKARIVLWTRAADILKVAQEIA
ncbi:hypothetical protein EC968_007874 [Mortierella alpina]|nr:hypothetical protein EC968_007874 [Mortierella alpina]